MTNLRSLSQWKSIDTSKSGRLSLIIQNHSLLEQSRVLELIEIGAVKVIRKKDLVDKTIGPSRLMKDSYISAGDRIFYSPTPKRYIIEEIDWARNIIAEDRDYLIVNKPAGIPCNHTEDNAIDSLRERLRRHLGADNELFLPHQIDTDVSGLLIVAKTSEANFVISRILGAGDCAKVHKLLLMHVATERGVDDGNDAPSSRMSNNDQSSLSEPSPFSEVGRVIENYSWRGEADQRVFSNTPKPGLPYEFNKRCGLRVLSRSPVASMTRRQWLAWLEQQGVWFQFEHLSDYLSKNVTTSANVSAYLAATESRDAHTDRFTQAFPTWLADTPDDALISFCEVEVQMTTKRRDFREQCRNQVRLLDSRLRVAGDSPGSAYLAEQLSRIEIINFLHQNIPARDDSLATDVGVEGLYSSEDGEKEKTKEKVIFDINTFQRELSMQHSAKQFKSWVQGFYSKEKVLRACWSNYQLYKDLVRKYRSGQPVDPRDIESLPRLKRLAKRDIMTVEIKRPWWFPLSMYLTDLNDNKVEE